MSGLEIPASARHVLRDGWDSENFYDHDEDADAHLRAVAAPVVAAELRRIADAWVPSLLGLDPGPRGELLRCVRELRGRANLLHVEEEA